MRELIWKWIKYLSIKPDFFLCHSTERVQYWCRYLVHVSIEMPNTILVEFYLLNEFNTSLKIKTKVNKDPINALSLVFFLFQNKHVMVEELLKLLVCEINTQLFEAIELVNAWKK